MLSEWQHGASLRLNKNPLYWNAKAIQLEEIAIPYVTSDAGASFNLFRNGSTAVAVLNHELAREALKDKLRIRKFVTGTLFFLQFNFRDQSLMKNELLRKAIQAVIDPSHLVNKVLSQPGIRPADSFFPSSMRGRPAPLKRTDKAELAALLATVKAELGEAPLKLRLLASDSPVSSRIAEYLQFVFASQLNIELAIEKQTFKQRLQQMRAGDFDMALSSWGPDYDDLMTYADLFASWNPTNPGLIRARKTISR